MSKAQCGVWIDQTQAIVVRFGPDGEARVERIMSGVAGRAKTRGGMSGSRGQISGASHKKPERRRLNELSAFYRDVSAHLRDAEEVAIIGPGEAKKHFEARLLDNNRTVDVAAVEPADSLTEPQVVARLREILRVPEPTR